jgi:exodeoxyribonuclease VII small subunit
MAEKSKSFDSLLERLEKIVEELESGDLPLEKSIARYEEGVKLLKECYAFLEKAEKKIQKLVKREDGTFSLEDFEPEKGEKAEE